MTKVIGDYDAAVTIDGSTHYLLIQPGSASTAYKKINRNVLLGVTGQPMDISSSQSVTNKTLDNTNTVTLKDTLFTLQDDGDATKQAKFQLSGITTATTRTYTLPNASSTLVDLSSSQTLTNKTLTSPVITGGSIDNSTVTVDTISGHTSATIVTVAGLQISNGALPAGSITPANLVSGTGSTWPSQAWTPSWTNLTLGSGATVVAQYSQIGKFVYAYVFMTLGTGFSITGSVAVSTPVNIRATEISGSSSITMGEAYYTRVGVAAYNGTLLNQGNNNSLGLFVHLASGTYVTSSAVTSTVPATWQAGDHFNFWFMYEAA